MPDALIFLMLLLQSAREEIDAGPNPSPEYTDVVDGLIDEYGAIDLLESLDVKDPLGDPGPLFSLNLRSRLQTRDPPQEGAPGNPVSAYSRLKLSLGSGTEIGGVWKRDAGEESRNALKSGYMSLHDVLPSVSVLLGDFSLESAQGLVFWSGSSLSKSSWTVTVPGKSPKGVIPHRSTEEIRFFRGVALSATEQFEQGRLEGIFFASSRRDAVRADTFGGRLLYRHAENLQAGLSFVRSRLGADVKRDDPMRFSGNAFDVAGVDMRWREGPVALFAEAARMRGSDAIVAGIEASAGRSISALILYRAYAPGFDNPYASGFGDNGATRNEEGIYAGVMLRPLSWLALSAYTDQFRAPARSAASQGNAAGNEWVLLGNAALGPRVGLSARLVARSVAAPLATRDLAGRESWALAEREQVRGRVVLSLRFVHGIEVKPRAEIIRVTTAAPGVSKGFLFGSDFRYQPSRHVHLSSQLLFFDADAYDARGYAFAANLPGAFSSQPLYGHGRRWSCALHLLPFTWCSVSAVIDVVEKAPSVTPDVRAVDVSASRQWHIGAQLDLRL